MTQTKLQLSWVLLHLHMPPWLQQRVQLAFHARTIQPIQEALLSVLAKEPSCSQKSSWNVLASMLLTTGRQNMLDSRVLTLFPMRLYTRLLWLLFRSTQRSAAWRDHYTTTFLRTIGLQQWRKTISNCPGRVLNQLLCRWQPQYQRNCETNQQCKAWLICAWPGYGPKTGRKRSLRKCKK
jgi:hypothetical protein